jgi:hypothetical protein
MGSQLHVRSATPQTTYFRIIIKSICLRNIVRMYTPTEASVVVTVFDSSDRTLFTSSGQLILPPDTSAPVPGCYIPPFSSLKTNFSFVFVTITTIPAPNVPRPFPKTYWLSSTTDVLDWCVFFPPAACLPTLKRTSMDQPHSPLLCTFNRGKQCAP